MTNLDVNFIAVIIAAAANMAVGALWYGPALGKMWQKLVGRKNPSSSTLAYGVSTLLSVLSAFVLAHFVKYAGAKTILAGAEIGFWAWLGFAFTTLTNNELFENRSKRLWIMNAGYPLISFITMGAVFGLLS